MSAMKERRFCNATEIVKNATDELKRAVTKWLPKMFPKLLLLLAEVCCWKGGLL
jgi:hypothetical protein